MNIKWYCVQPLSGAIYLAAEEVIGHPAEFIASFPGLEKQHLYKDGKLIRVGNERNLLEYLNKRKRRPQYVQFTTGMFNLNSDQGLYFPEEYNTGMKIDHDSFQNADFVCALPVCSGLSNANRADHGKKDSAKNDNMRMITELVLSSNTKVFLFENAPALYTNKGAKVRADLEELALKFGYSITYIKTNSMLHNNVQCRQRTYVIFWQWPNGKPVPPPMISYENKPVKDIMTFLSQIKANATQNRAEDRVFDINTKKDYLFMRHKFGDKWREEILGTCITHYIMSNNLELEAAKWIDDPKYTRWFNHCRHKLNQGMGYYDCSLIWQGPEKVKTIFFKNDQSLVHPEEDRAYTMREVMTFMNMPQDFEYLHEPRTCMQVMGQNVPLNTARFWISQAVGVLQNWGTDRMRNPSGFDRTNIYFHDNIKPENSHYGK